MSSTQGGRRACSWNVLIARWPGLLRFIEPGVAPCHWLFPLNVVSYLIGPLYFQDCMKAIFFVTQLRGRRTHSNSWSIIIAYKCMGARKSSLITAFCSCRRLLRHRKPNSLTAAVGPSTATLHTAGREHTPHTPSHAILSGPGSILAHLHLT